METWHPFFGYITDIGDSALLAAIACGGSVYLLLEKELKTASILLGALVIAAVGTAILKIVFIGCSGQIDTSVYSPSGHTAMSTAVLGTFGVIVSRSQESKWHLLSFAVVVPLIGIIAFSRIALGYHTVPEVLIGLVLGCTVALVAFCLIEAKKLPPLKITTFLIIVLAIGLSFYGAHISLEPWLQRWAPDLLLDGSLCRILGHG